MICGVPNPHIAKPVWIAGRVMLKAIGRVTGHLLSFSNRARRLESKGSRLCLQLSRRCMDEEDIKVA